MISPEAGPARIALSNPNDNSNESTAVYYQIASGAVAAALLVGGVLGYVTGNGHPFALGMAVRIGATMAVISLAMPQLYRLRNRIPGIALGIALACVLLIAVRPKLGNVLISLGAILLAVNFALGWMASVAGKRR